MIHAQDVIEKELLKIVLRHPSGRSSNIDPELFITPLGQVGIKASQDLAEAQLEPAFGSFISVIGESLSAIGGVAVVSDLFSESFTPSLAVKFVTDLQDSKAKRTVAKLGYEMSALAQSGGTTAEIAELNQSLQEALTPPAVAKSKTRAAREYLQEIITECEDASQGKVKDPPYTGLPLLDYHIDGIVPSTFMVIAGKTSGGKTALALQLAKEYSVEQGFASLYASYEMPGKMLMRRILSAEARVPLKAIKAGKFTEHETSRVETSIFKVMHSGLHVMDQVQDMGISELRSACRSAKSMFGIGLIIVDYIQIVPGNNSKDARERQVAEISYGLQKMAQELECCVIGLSQLNDDGLLRESRAIGHDADVVMVIEGDNDDDDREIHLVKVRNGPTGKVPVTFEREIQRFVQR